MAFYELTERKIHKLENILTEYPPYLFKEICKELLNKNYVELRNQFYDTYAGKFMWFKFNYYGMEDAANDAHAILNREGLRTVGNFYKYLSDTNEYSQYLNIAIGLNKDDICDFLAAYEIKELLYRIKSYTTAYRNDYKFVMLSFSEMKDVEGIIQLSDSGELLELLNKYESTKDTQ